MVEAALQRTLERRRSSSRRGPAPGRFGPLAGLAGGTVGRPGTPAHLIGLVQDITTRRQAESNLAFLAELSEAFAFPDH